jgi:arylsulfatase A-like enzyme
MKRKLNRREALGGLSLMGASSLAALTGCGTRAPRRGAHAPNIIFIMSDDHAAHALSCYRSRINTTPNLDRIARGGMRLENCFCTNSICAPSRAAILTGKYSHANGLKTNRDPFDGSQITFPKLLQQAGYQTAMIGKWHLKSEPTGFDYWNVLPGQGNYHDPVLIEMGERNKHQGYVTDLITDFTMDFLEHRDRSRPFCVMCHHKAPHRRWFPDEAHASLYADGNVPVPETFDDDYANRGQAARLAEMRIDTHLNERDLKIDPPEGLSPEQLKHWKYQRYMADYLACVASVDDNVGRLLDFINAQDLAEDTVVVYTSDQGFYLGDHGWFDKRFMYEESLRMPCLIRYPREIGPGSVCDAMVLNVDFAPTFLDFADVPTGPATEMHGRSFRSILRGERPRNWRASMYYQYYEFPAVHSVRKHYGVRTERYKLIRYYGEFDEWELFDLDRDPNELRSVYDDPAYAGTVDALKQELRRLRAELGVTDGPAV